MGDFDGHPFRGNQWTSGTSSARSDSPMYADHIDSVQEYQAGTFEHVVAELRAGGEPNEDSTRFQAMFSDELGAASAVEALDNEISQWTLKEDTTLYRIVTGKFAETLQPGSTFQDGAYLSTTHSLAAANFMAKEWGRGPDGSMPVLLHIRLRAGDNAMDMNAFHARAKSQNLFPDQEEVVLPRAITFSVSREGKTLVLTKEAE